MGWLPNPPYLPPCEGGRSSDRFAFAAPSPAKYLSSTFTFPLEGLVFRAPRGVCDRELEELWFEIDVAAVVDFEAGALGTGTYSRFSTLAVRRSLYSSPTSPPYRSAIVASSQLWNYYQLSTTANCHVAKIVHLRDTTHNISLILIEEFPPSLVSSKSHPLNFLRLECIHRDTPHETNMYS